MINLIENNGLKILQSDTGFIAKADKTAVYEGNIYLGKYDSQDNYIEITAAEKEQIEAAIEEQQQEEQNKLKPQPSPNSKI